MAYRNKSRQRSAEATKTVVSENYVAKNKPTSTQKAQERSVEETNSALQQYALLDVKPKLGIMHSLLMHTPQWVLRMRIKSALLLIALLALLSPFIVIIYVTIAYLVLIFVASFVITRLPMTVAETMGSNSTAMSTSIDSLFNLQVVPSLFVATALAIMLGLALYQLAKFTCRYVLSMWAPIVLPKELSEHVVKQRSSLDVPSSKKSRKHLVDLVAKD